MKKREEPDEVPLERALDRLEEIAARLESGKPELSESLALFEEGVRLLRVADGVLARAEERVQQLRADGEGFRFEPLPERP